MRPSALRSAIADPGRPSALARGLLSSTALVRSGAAAALLACLSATSARAQDATWSTSPADNNFFNAANWSPATVPTGTASFGATSTPAIDVNVGSATSIGGFTFNPGAANYDLAVRSIAAQFLTFTGAGLIINGGSVNITTSGLGGGGVIFQNSSSAGSATITNNSGGLTIFDDTSTAGSATIISNHGSEVRFLGFSSGGTARLILISELYVFGLTAGSTTIGSLEGTGDAFLGAKNLAVGSNNLSTTFSGILHDSDPFSGPGGGSFTKVGAGTLTLSGTSTYTGATTVDGGTLSVTGDISTSSGVAVNAGGTLNGTGTVSSIAVNSGGVLMPGLPGSVGTLNATGNVTFNPGAAYQVAFQGATNSLTQAAGGAALDGGAHVAVAGGSTINVGQKYTILTALGGVTGAFDPTVNFGTYRGTFSYDPNDVFLTFAFANFSPLLPAGAPINAINVAGGIDAFSTGGGTLPPGFQNLFNFTPQQLAGGLLQLSGEVGTGAKIAGFGLMNDFMSLMLDPLAQGHGNGIGPVPFAPAEQRNVFAPAVASAYASVLKAPSATQAPLDGRWNAWGTAYGGANTVSGSPTVVGSHDVAARAGGFAAGLDYRVSPDAIVGFALAGAGTGWDLAAGMGSGHSDVFQAGVYGARQFGPAYLSGTLAFANHWASTSRVVSLAGTDTLKADFDAQSFGGRLESGYRVRLAPVTVTPYVAMQAQAFHTPGYNESAASGSAQFALSYGVQTAAVLRGELGSWISKDVMLAGGDSVALFGRAAWAHDRDSNPALTPTFQGLPGASFTVNGATLPSDLALVTAGAELRLRGGWSLMGRFDGELAEGSHTYTGSARVRYAW